MEEIELKKKKLSQMNHCLDNMIRNIELLIHINKLNKNKWKKI